MLSWHADCLLELMGQESDSKQQDQDSNPDSSLLGMNAKENWRSSTAWKVQSGYRQVINVRARKSGGLPQQI